tara:strand:+ start:4040 stop:4381 length:342 start_codon:yes stop_codon:yes gene_type:complete
MQDNVTQALPVIQADRDAAADQYRYLSATGMPMMRAGKMDGNSLVQAFAAHRLASTAQPEVKGLVEALEREAKKAAEMAAYAVKHDFDAMGEALDNMRHRLEAALAAYHEAQP